jgi:purine nucleosidase
MRKVVLDCDPGNDDALALMMLAADPGADLLAVTTVAGNVDRDMTAENALALVGWLGLDIPVAKGAGPLLEPYERLSASLMGPRGLGVASLPAPSGKLSPKGSSELLWELVQAYPGELEILATGPLTNLALLLREHPEAAAKICRICLMGGSRGAGNTTPRAEFNIHTDPEAAQIVFASGIPLTMVGLEVGYAHRLCPRDFVRLIEAAPSLGAFVGSLFFYPGTPEKRLGERGWPVFDSLAAACLLVPEAAQTASWHVAVECRGELTRGETVVDERGRLGLAPNCDVVLDFPHERYLALVEESLCALEARLP